MKEDFSTDRMISVPDLSEVDEGIDSSEESTIEPSSTLRNEFWYRIFNSLAKFRGKH